MADGDGTPSARAFWSGTLTFGLVSVPVDLYPAVRSGGESLRMLDDKGTPLARRYHNPEKGRNVPSEKIIRGFEIEEGEFVPVTEEELEAVAPEKSRDIDLRRFVPLEQLDPLYFQRAYFLTPGGSSTKAYRLLAETMEKTDLAGIATFVMRGIEYLVAIIAEDGILRAETLRFHDEVRSPEDVGLPKPEKPPTKEVRRIARAIEARSQKELDEEELADHRAERLHALVERKRRKGEDVVEAPEAEAEEAEEKVIDLLEVLRRSMKEAGRGAGRRPAERAERASGGERKDLASLTKRELYERAKELDIPGRSSMSREELLKALRGAA